MSVVTFGNTVLVDHGVTHEVAFQYVKTYADGSDYLRVRSFCGLLMNFTRDFARTAAGIPNCILCHGNKALYETVFQMDLDAREELERKLAGLL